MFTGIIENLGEILAIKHEQSNIHFKVKASFLKSLKIDQSIAHNGVCLTVTAKETDGYWVTAIQETLNKTNLGAWQVGTQVNLERCLQANGRLDGHIVQGHVDQIGICTQVKEMQGSWEYHFEFDSNLGNLTISKGSICVNGVSLTVVESHKNSFSVAIIPYTYEHTNFHLLKGGDQVNLEFDVIGKYVSKILNGFLFERNITLK